MNACLALAELDVGGGRGFASMQLLNTQGKKQWHIWNHKRAYVIVLKRHLKKTREEERMHTMRMAWNTKCTQTT